MRRRPLRVVIADDQRLLPEALRALLVAVVLLTESADAALATAALARGVRGVIVKGSDPDALAPALRAAIRREAPRRENPMVLAKRREPREGIAARLDALRALVDRAIFGHDYDWL